MELTVDLDKVVVTFADFEDVDRVIVRVVSPPAASAADEAAVHRLEDVLAATNVGELEHAGRLRAWISPAAARFHAAGQVGPGWSERLAARCADSAARGGRPSLEGRVLWPGERP